MIGKMDSLKRTVFELCLGILIYGIIFEVIGLFLARDRAAHSVGILCGILIAMAMTVHMARNIDDALYWDAEHAAKILRRGSVFRYAAVAGMTILLAYLKVGNVMSCFAGIMTLKAAAYTQPLLHKVINKIYKIEEGGYEDAIVDDEDEFDFSQWAEYGFHDPRSD